MLVPPMTTTAAGLEVGVASGVAGLMMMTPPDDPAEIRCPSTVITDPGARVCDPMMKFEAVS
jgi:hypothetical protein